MIHLKLYHYLSVLLETQSPHYSAFLVIKSVKKANFPPFEPLNQVYLLSSELCDPSEAIPLLTSAFGDSEPSLFHFFGHKIGQKGEFPPFCKPHYSATYYYYYLTLPSFLIVVLQIVVYSFGFWLVTLSVKCTTSCIE